MKSCKVLNIFLILITLNSTSALATGPNFTEMPKIKNELSCKKWAEQQYDQLQEFPIVTSKGVYYDHIPVKYAVDQCIGRKSERYFLLSASAAVDEELCRKFQKIKYCVDFKELSSDPSPKWQGNRGN